MDDTTEFDITLWIEDQKIGEGSGLQTHVRVGDTAGLQWPVTEQDNSGFMEIMTLSRSESSVLSKKIDVKVRSRSTQHTQSLVYLDCVIDGFEGCTKTEESIILTHVKFHFHRQKRYPGPSLDH